VTGYYVLALALAVLVVALALYCRHLNAVNAALRATDVARSERLKKFEDIAVAAKVARVPSQQAYVLDRLVRMTGGV
jgi:hypothetical protein